MTIKRVIPRPTPQEVVEWEGDNLAEIEAFTLEHVTITENPDGTLSVNDGMGSVTVPLGGHVMPHSAFSNPIEGYQEVPPGALAYEVVSDE